MAEGDQILTGQGDTTSGEGSTGQTQTSWLDTLPEDIRGNEALKAYESPEALAKAHIETLGKVASPPETADAYQVSIPEGHPVDPGFVSQVKTWALESGMSQEQFAKLASRYIESEQAAIKEAQIAEEKGIAELKKEWGSQFDESVLAAQKAVQQFLSADERKWLNETRLGNNPTFIRMFARIGAKVADDKFIDGQGGGKPDISRDYKGTPMLSDYAEMKGSAS